MKILFTTDGSYCSNAALEKLSIMISQLENVELYVISVADTAHQGYVGPFGVLNEYYTEMANEAIRLAEQAVRHTVEALNKKNPDLIIVSNTYVGEPKKIILENAHALGVDLIVMGAYGHGAIDRFIWGSVSNAVALHSECSVMIMRPDNNRL